LGKRRRRSDAPPLSFAAVHAQAALRADPATPKPENCAAEAALVAQPIP